MSDSAAAAPARPRVLVTGAAGFIGSHLVDALLARGHDVLGVDCFTDYYPRAVKERNLAAALTHARFTFEEADLRTAELQRLTGQVDVVIHEAAMGGLLRSWTWFAEYASCNVLATQRLLEACRDTGISHVVHASTSSVYGRDASAGEDRAPQPDSPYGVTKLAAEHLVAAYHRNFEVPFTVLRYFSIYGPRQRPDMGYHIFIDSVLNDREIVILGDGLQSRGNTYIDDCVAATIAALDRGPTLLAINIGGGEEISALEAVRLIGRLAGREPRIAFGPARPGEQARALADTARARSVLGWAPRIRIVDGLTRQLAWQQAILSAQAGAAAAPAVGGAS
jgi:nucleoside-diphosphate-sugar epimerase